MIFKDYITEIENFYNENGIELDPIPTVKINTSKVDLFDPYIKTGHYIPQTKTIVLYVNNRHLKDILRTFCHELIHHYQNIKEDKFNGLDVSGNLNENQDLETLEAEAYQMGNIMFRKWTETKK